MKPASPTATVLDEVATWAGITTQPTPRGATAILFEGHELGHLHASRGMLGLPLPADRRAQVLEASRAKEWFSGWVTKQLASRADADDGIALLRESYDALRAPLVPPQEASNDDPVRIRRIRERRGLDTLDRRGHAPSLGPDRRVASSYWRNKPRPESERRTPRQSAVRSCAFS
jgi:Luciferase